MCLEPSEKPLKKLQYPFAKNTQGELVMIEHSKKSTQYNCWGCGQRMFARMGDERAHHFYHKFDNDSTRCSVETALHKAFKTKLHQRIERCLSYNNKVSEKKEEIVIEWKCIKCHDIHRYNLLNHVTKSGLEKPVYKYRPDISLYRNHSTIHAVVEIIVTHPIEAESKYYYGENNIPIIEFKPTIDDLEKIEDKILIVHYVNICFEKKDNETELSENIADLLDEQTVEQIILFLRKTFKRIFRFFS